ncbi:hypothetical protein GGS21DRAFT_489535 [Xylaria nigripes]|nr:hypothetical protein GGS21DRAFT_489535 [Xylaria nigripes]
MRALTDRQVDVIIEEGSAFEENDSPKINRYRYNFVKKHAGSTFSFLDSQLVVGEPIVVSDEKGHFALALGYVTAVRKHKISVAVDRRLHNARIRRPGFDARAVLYPTVDIRHRGLRRLSIVEDSRNLTNEFISRHNSRTLYTL